MRNCAADRSVLNRWIVGVAVLTIAAVALSCAPGMDDDLVARLGSGVSSWLPLWVRWGLADAVMLPKLAALCTLAPLLISLGVALAVLRTQPPAGRDVRLIGLAAVYLGMLVGSSVRSMSGVVSLEPLAMQSAVVLVALAVAWGASRPAMERVLPWVAACGVVIAAYALAQHEGWDLLAWTPQALVRQRSIGTLGNPDYLGAWLVMTLPFAVLGMRSARSAAMSAAWGAGCAATLVALVFTYTRGAWLAGGFEVGVAVLWWARRRPFGPPSESPAERSLRAGTWSFALVGVLLTVAMLQAAPRGRSSLLTEAALHTVAPTDGSSLVRFALWREALMIGCEYPALGTGPGTFSYAARPHRWVEPPWLKGRVGISGDPHNEFLGVMAGSGWPALLLFGCVLGVALRRMGSAVPRDPAAFWCLLALTGWGVAHLFVQATAPDLLLAWWLVGWAAAGEEPPPGIPGGRRGWAAAGMVALGLIGLLLAGRAATRALAADLDSNVAVSLGHQALAESGASSARCLRQSFVFFENAERHARGLRRARMLSQNAALLAALYARSSPALRDGPEGVFWHGVERRVVTCYRETLRVNPLDPYAWNDLARFLFLRATQPDGSRSEAMAAALQVSRQGCDLDPYNAALWADHARRCREARCWEQAEEAFRRSLTLFPEQARLALEFGQMLTARSRAREARQWFEAARRLDPTQAEAEHALRVLPSGDKPTR